MAESAGEQGWPAGIRDALSATRFAQSRMSGWELNAAVLRSPSTFIRAHWASELPYAEGPTRAFLASSAASRRVASTYPVRAAPKHGNPARTGCSVIDPGCQTGTSGGFLSP